MRRVATAPGREAEEAVVYMTGETASRVCGQR